MRRILIATFSKHGHTRKIGRYLARKIEDGVGEACEFIYYDLDKDFDRELPPLLETVVIGVPIRFARLPRAAQKWVRRHRFELMALRASLFVVCLNAADPRSEAREAEAQIIEKFLLNTRWEPASHRVFAGALAYSKYPFLLRWVMQQISKTHGGPTDTSRDHDLTDYRAVDGFASEIAREIEHRHSLHHQIFSHQKAK